MVQHQRGSSTLYPTAMILTCLLSTSITLSTGASLPLRSSPVWPLGPNYDTDLTWAMDDVSISPAHLCRLPQPLHLQSPIAEAIPTTPQTRPSPRPAPPLVPLADIPQRNLGWIREPFINSPAYPLIVTTSLLALIMGLLKMTQFYIL